MRRRSSRNRGATCVAPIQSLNVIKKATTSSICCALRTGLSRQAAPLARVPRTDDTPHDRGGIDPVGIDDPEPQLALGPPRAGSPEIGREVALEPLLRERPAVAEQAQTHLPVGDDRAAARGIALGAGERLRDRVLSVCHAHMQKAATIAAATLTRTPRR